jgi:DNA-binding transcriptional MerR regulator
MVRDVVMNIGELARSAETTPETIRYYERIGLLPRPPRTAANYRDYSSVDSRRISFARRARELGFSIQQIRALLALADATAREAADMIARDQLREVRRKQADLSALRRELEFFIGQPRDGRLPECRLIEALAPVA